MKWLSLRIGGQKVAVHLVRPKHPKLEGCVGMYYEDAASIYLSSALSSSAREDALIHELEHAVNAISGANNVLFELVGGPVDDPEERIVRCRTPIWHALLNDLGFRFPKGPNE